MHDVLTITLAQCFLSLVLLAALFARERDHQNAIATERDLASAERAAIAAENERARDHDRAALLELVNKIQHPQVYRPTIDLATPPTRAQDMTQAPMDGFELAGRAIPDEQFASLQHLFDEQLDAGEPVTP